MSTGQPQAVARARKPVSQLEVSLGLGHAPLEETPWTYSCRRYSQPHWLARNLMKLDHLPRSEVSDTARKNARNLIEALNGMLDREYDIVAGDGQQVAIGVTGTKPHTGMTIECTKAGRVECYVTIGQNNRTAIYYQMDGLPDGFIRDAIRDLR